MALRRPSTALSAAGLNINDLRSMIKLDTVASTELDARIDQFREELRSGRKPPVEKLEDMEFTNRDITKDVVQHIDKIESQGTLTKTDREVLQALHARLSTCDVQRMRLAELRDRLTEMQHKEAALPLGGKPRTHDNSPTAPIHREASPGPALERISSRDSVSRMTTACPGTASRTYRRESRDLPTSPLRRISAAPYSKSASSIPPPRYDPQPSRAAPDGGVRSGSSPMLQKIDTRDIPELPSPRGNPATITSAPPKFPSPPIASPVLTPTRRSLDNPRPTPACRSVESPVSAPLRRSATHQADKLQEPPSPRHITTETQYARPDSSLEPRSRRGRLPPGTPSPRRSPRVDTPIEEEEQLKYDDFYHVNRLADALPSIDIKMSWPILYQVFNVDPKTDPTAYEVQMTRSLACLKLKYDHGDDPDSAARWHVICRAYDVLNDPARKKLYDLYGIETTGLEHVDFRGLGIV